MFRASTNLSSARQATGALCRQLLTIVLLGVALWTSGARPVRAQPAATPVAEATPQAAAPEDAFDRGVPRTAMRGYLQACRDNDYARAANYLDLSHIHPDNRATQGPVLARHLKVVLDRTLWVDLDALSDSPEGEADDGLPGRRDLVGTIQAAKGPVEILLDHVRRTDGVPIWKISSATVAKIPALYQEFGYGPLGELLPAPLFEIRFLEIELWQWIGFILLIAVASLVSWVIAAVIARLIRPLLSQLRESFEDTLDQLIVGPVRLLIGIVIFYAGSFLLALSVPVQTLVNGSAKAVVVIATTWLVLRIVDIATIKTRDLFVARGQAVAVAMLPLGRRTVKVVLVALAILAVLQNLGFNVTGVLAGLGVGGLAVALAAQETVKNFFGGIALIADQPVRVGDFCRFGDRVGTVEDISLWSTRIRTLDRTVVSIPNSEFVGLQLENFARRDRIWLHPTIGLRYETTPDQLRFVLIELKKMLVAHPKVHPDPARVRFTNFNAYSLDLEIFAYVLTADINEFLAVQEDIFLRIMDIVNASGTGFAFPSQTNYFARDGGLDEEKSRAAEEQVQQWRKQNALYLPTLPQEQVAQLDDTLDYPPQGSPTRS